MTIIGPTFTTKRQETAESQIAMMQTPLGQIIATTAPDMVIAAQDWAGADKLAERIKRTLPPELTQDDSDDEQSIPPQVQQAMQQMSQTIEQLQAALQEADAQVQSKEADMALKQADLQLKQQNLQVSGQSDMVKAQSDQMRAQIDQEKLMLEGQKLEFERAKLDIELQSEQMRQQFEMDKMRLTAKMSQTADNLDPELNNGEEPPMAMMFRNLQESMNAGLEAIANITAQSSQAVVESNMMVAQSQSQMAQAINTPKVVIRDANGLIAGIE
jgi:hypothetical protein